MAGRPTTHPIKKLIAFSENMIDAVETWRARQRPVPAVSEAIRRLVEIGLAQDQQSVKQLHEAKSHADLAAELAADIGLKPKSRRRVK